MAHTRKNRLYLDQQFFQNRRPVRINKTIIPALPTERNRLYLGMGTGGNRNRFDLTGSLLYTIPKKNMAVSGSYAALSKSYFATIYFGLGK
jgi:hypothetical protein